jgi:hypothetical protein
MSLSICELVRKSENDYVNGKTTISKYVDFSQYENIEKIDAYLNSRHISGERDSMGRDKPFFNIVTGAVNIWYRATDIDRKNIRIKATKQADFIGAFLATIHLQEWMKKDAFGVFLNGWGRSLARYGSSVVKFVEKGGKLHAAVISWNRLITDVVDFENNPKIERLFYTPAQLRRNKAYDQDMVTALIHAHKVARETPEGNHIDNKNDYIEVYEVHGELPLSMLTMDDNDCEEYVQQMQVVSYVKSKKTNEYEDFCLLKGKEARDPYMITHLIKEDGRAQSIGAVEHLFDAQWMTNHTAKTIKDQLDLASKLIFQTSDVNFVGMNVLSAIESGDILIHSDSAPLTQLNNGSHDITSLQNFGQQWQVLAKEITSTPDAISGNTMPSGTAYRQVAILNQESHSLFEIMTENKGLAIEEMMRKFVLPYLKKQMDTTEEITATLDSHGIKQIEMMYVNNEAVRRHNAKATYEALNGLPVEGLDIEAEKAKISGEMAAQGNQRFIKPSDIPTKTWKQIFKDLVWDVEVEVTNEQSDKEAVMTTLTTVLQTIGGNPAILQDPNMRMLFNKILETTGAISTIELSQNPQNQPQPQQAQPEMGAGMADAGAEQPVPAV